LEVLEQRDVRLGSGVVELVDDHHVEVLRIERLEARRAEALDRREDVLEPIGARATDPELAERRVTQAVSEESEASA
jgi:hypothetical protein